MKKRLVLKSWVKETLFVIVAILAIVGCFKLLQLQDQHEYQRAVERCGGESNITERYTNQGDKYDTCTIEK